MSSSLRQQQQHDDAPEKMAFTLVQQGVYDSARLVLQQPSDFLAPIPKIVSLDTNMDDGDDIISMITPSKGHHELHSKVELLEGLEKEEHSLLLKSDLSRQLTTLLDPHTNFSDSAAAIQRLEHLGHSVPRRVCQHPFKKNDIVWVCRTCQADETCVLCHNCYSQSNHEGHDVAFYHAQAGGCCDCGDPDAWDPEGFCPRHGPNALPSSTNADASLPPEFVSRVGGVVPACVDWMVQSVAHNAETAYARAHPVDDSGQRLTSHAFSPEVASNPLAVLTNSQQKALQHAQELGTIGRTGHGLYIVLHADDIHSTSQYLDALKDFLGRSNYYADSLLNTVVKALRQYGQLVVWGTKELIVECGATQVHLWMDGDRVATGRVGAAILNKSDCLARHGLFCSILTRDELIVEQRSVAVLQWLSVVARSCDPLCVTVAANILPNRHLVPLLRADFKMSARVTKAWYALLLTLLAVPTFKSHLAAAYCDTYQTVTAKYARGMGVLERSGYTLSVQFLNRVTYVIDLVQKRDLLGKLGRSLLETLQVATNSEWNGRLDPNHFVLTHRRYSPCVSDLKCVLNVSGMPRVIAASKGTFLSDWIQALGLAQFMDTQIWRHHSQAHVEDEARGWVGAFNASISLGSLFDRLLGWSDEETSPIKEGPLSVDLKKCVELSYHILLHGIDPWQKAEREHYSATSMRSALESFKRAPASLPFSTVASKHGTNLAMRQLPASQVSPFSFHLPLHRFFSACLRELCLRKDSAVDGIENLLFRLRDTLSEDQRDELFQGLMEFPVLVLSRAAQVRAGLWRRNGPGLNDQVLNYAEPPFCRNMRDADLLMTQFAVLGRIRYQGDKQRPDSDCGISFLMNLMIHRLGLFDFVGLAKAPTWNVYRYSQEVKDGLYPVEKRYSSDMDLDDAPLPWSYSAARDASSAMLLLEEFLHFVIMFVTVVPSVVPEDKKAQIDQARSRLFLEVIHRLASGAKTHSELSEVHHVLSHWDNALLSEEGKLLNPDDAGGAALGAVLDEVATRKVSRGKMEPDKWELKRSAWESYDPSFYHCSLRSHQTAAEERPKPRDQPNTAFGWEAKPYAPKLAAAHPVFKRLRRDATADATALSIAYRVLHIHCRENVSRSLLDLRGSSSYTDGERSETSLARAIHFITLGAYAWAEDCEGGDWRRNGGGSVGSIFFDRDLSIAPTVKDWVKEFLLADPKTLLDCDWYTGEEKLLVLLRRLAVTGGIPGGFIAQDTSVRSGAAWLCEFALSCCPEAGSIITPLKQASPDDSAAASKKASELERRKQLAKEKAMAMMKARADNFARMMEVDLGSEDESVPNTNASRDSSAPNTPVTPGNPIRKTSFGSALSTGTASSVETGTLPNFVTLGECDEALPRRLLQTRPRCFICNDEDASEGRLIDKLDDDGESQRKKSRRRTENAIGFVGYTQASTVLKGGGGPPLDNDSPWSPVREFVGTHVTLCGHAVHSECCESYLATVSQREDRQIGKRDEFRCPLCQRLSNCLVPFIDVGADWVASDKASTDSNEDEKNDEMMEEKTKATDSPSLQSFLESTSWWVTRGTDSYRWDGQSAFIESNDVGAEDERHGRTRRPARIRSLKKKDLYAAWNAMMRTPRLVRRRLRRSSSRLNSPTEEFTPRSLPTGEDSVGETVVWRRFMDQISEIGYRADNKRLGDGHLHDCFGEFRHYIVEKFAYNTVNRFAGSDPTDVSSNQNRLLHDLTLFRTVQWPSCLFKESPSENRRQEMSREKLLSKLLLSVQSFVYSCACEAFEVRRCYKRHLQSSTLAASKTTDTSIEALFSRFGIDGFTCEDILVVMSYPPSTEEGGTKPFDGRLGKLRYLGLAVMAAAGAVATDLLQIVLPFPLKNQGDAMEVDGVPKRAPIAYPILYGNVLTHVVAAICASCGRARARSDALDVVWPFRLSKETLNVSENRDDPNSVLEDCNGFLKLGVFARLLQVLLGKMESFSPSQSVCRSTVFKATDIVEGASGLSVQDQSWMLFCLNVLDKGLSRSPMVASSPATSISLEQIREMSYCAASAATNFVADAGIIAQILVPGFLQRRGTTVDLQPRSDQGASEIELLTKIISFFQFEPLEDMLQCPLMQEIITNWVACAFHHKDSATGSDEASTALNSRLFQTQGFRVHDWPSAGRLDKGEQPLKSESNVVEKTMVKTDQVMYGPDTSDPMQTESIGQPTTQSTSDSLRSITSPTLLTFSSKKSVPLIGGFPTDGVESRDAARPHVVVIPTSYTDLYAELASLMPDCEQTAVCLICGEVLNASGKGECTRHSFKCGAGAGMFFLLQECSGLIMHKTKAAYIHSPYVDSHGETPQYRGRPLNLDLDRYEHLRELWYSHGVRQKVVAERVGTRQMIVPEFY